jgi:hypothetical protein
MKPWFTWHFCFKWPLENTPQFNSNKSPTTSNSFPVYYSDVYLQLNMFQAFSRPSSGAQWLQWLAGHYEMKVKPEAATTVTELLMMGGKTTKTCWAVNKRQDNRMENCCIWLVIYLYCTMMHILTNLKHSWGLANLTLHTHIMNLIYIYIYIYIYIKEKKETSSFKIQ